MKTINTMRQVYFLDDSWAVWLNKLPNGVAIKCDTDRDYLITAEYEDMTAEYNCTVNELPVDILSDTNGKYREIQFENTTQIDIPGLGIITVTNQHPDDEATDRWVMDFKLSSELDKTMFDCGLNLWYDKAEELAEDLNINAEVLQYHFASCNALDIVFYEGDRWMPELTHRILKLCMAEEFTYAEMQDKEFMDHKYFIWAESGMLS